MAATTSLGATAMHWAAYHDRVEVAALLISRGAPLGLKDDDGETPASLAMQAGDGAGGDVLELLKGLARHDREQKQKQQRDRDL